MEKAKQIGAYRNLSIRRRTLNYALFGACQNADLEVARWALANGAQPNWAGYSPLHIVCDRNHREIDDSDLVEMAQLLIDCGADVNAFAFSWGGTPIWYASYKGSYGLVKLLIDRRADVNLDSPHGSQKILCQPLICGWLDIASLLINAKAELDNIDLCGTDARTAAELYLMGDTLTDALEMIDNAIIARNQPQGGPDGR